MRTETYFAARAHAQGLRALETAIDASPGPSNAESIAARGALHMRAAVIAGRAGDASAAKDHLTTAREWVPPDSLPEERRSGFYIELARAQLWAGRPDDAFASLKTARRIAPQHAREHAWVREDAATLRRLKRGDAESLTRFAEWCQAGPYAHRSG
ncbi:hypothetical protein ACR820_09615 [Streptomyces netropsis]